MKVAIVGLGYWGPVLVRNLMSLESCSSVMVCDRDPARVAHVTRLYPGAQGCTDFNEVLGDPDVRAVVVATPVRTHAALATEALKAGKSVLVEKPLAGSLADAEALVALASAQGQLVMAGHTFLYSPPVLAVKALIKSGELGEPLYVQSSRVNLGIHQADVSVLWDLAPHDLSIVSYWLGEQPVRVSAIGRSTVEGAPIDVAFVNLEYASGVVANLHLSWLAPTKVRRTTLVCASRMVVYEDSHPEEPVKIYNKGLSNPSPEDYGQYRMTYRTGDVTAPFVESWEPLRAELGDFVARVDRGETPDKREAIAVAIVATIEGAQRSVDLRGTPVDL
jgi:predicted dehydrogenase